MMFKPTETEIEVGPVPSATGNRYYYRIRGHLSLQYYANDATARSNARRVQYVNDAGRIEPLESAEKFGRKEA
jgi:hypothetical protein